MSWSWSGLAALGVALAACGSQAAAPRAHERTPNRPEGRARPTAASAWSRDVVVGHGAGATSDLGELPGGDRLLITGGHRVRVHANRAMAARDVDVLPFIGGAQQPDGSWRFMDRGSRLWRAADPLGDLEPTGSLGLGRSLVYPADARGVIIFRDEDPGALWATDGVSEPRLVLDAPVLSAAFLDPRVGLALLDGLTLWSTVDGGRHWRPFRPGEAIDGSVEAIVAVEDDWRLGQASAPDLRVERGGRISAIPPTFSYWLGGAWAVEVLTALPAVLGSHQVRFRGGFLIRGRQRGMFNRVLRDGTLEAGFWPVPGEHVHLGDSQFGVIAFADRRHYWSDDARHFYPAPRLSEHRDVIRSLDGRTAVISNQAETAIEWAEAGGPRFEARLPPGRSVEGVIAARGNLVIGTWFDESTIQSARGANHRMSVIADRGRPEPFSFRIDTRAFESIPLDRPVTGGYVLDDGRIVLRTVAAAGVRNAIQLWIGPTSGPFVEIALPDGATWVDFADSRRWVASGRSLLDVWRSASSGASWERIPMSTTRAAAGLGADPVYCAGEICTVASRYDGHAEVVVQVRGWESDVRPSERLVGAVSDDMRAALYAARDRQHDDMLAIPSRWGCDGAEYSRAERTPTGHLEFTLGDAAGQMEVNRSLRTVRLVWSARDAHGLYEASASWSPAEWVFVEPRLHGWLRPVLVDRRAAVLVACLRERASTHCRGIMARPGAPMTTIPMSDSAAVRTDGALLLSIDNGIETIDVDGSRRRRDFAGRFEGISVALTTSQSPRVLILRAGRRWTAISLDRVAMPRWMAAVDRVCTAPTPAGVTTIAVPDRASRWGWNIDWAVARLEIGTSESCLRSVDLGGTESISGHLESQPDGTLRGWRAQHHRRREAACFPER